MGVCIYIYYVSNNSPKTKMIFALHDTPTLSLIHLLTIHLQHYTPKVLQTTYYPTKEPTQEKENQSIHPSPTKMIGPNGHRLNLHQISTMINTPITTMTLTAHTETDHPGHAGVLQLPESHLPQQPCCTTQSLKLWRRRRCGDRQARMCRDTAPHTQAMMAVAMLC